MKKQLFDVTFYSECAFCTSATGEAMKVNVWNSEMVNKLFPGADGLRLAEGEDRIILNDPSEVRAIPTINVMVRDFNLRSVKLALVVITGRPLEELEINVL
jgi:hypothetical protein